MPIHAHVSFHTSQGLAQSLLKNKEGLQLERILGPAINLMFLVLFQWLSLGWEQIESCFFSARAYRIASIFIWLTSRLRSGLKCNSSACFAASWPQAADTSSPFE